MDFLTNGRSKNGGKQKTGSEISAANSRDKNRNKTKVKKLSKLQERRTAYHEAGHAVAFYLFGEALDYVTIIPDFEKGELGRVQPVRKTLCPALDFGSTFSMEGRAEFEREVITSLAGKIAEVKYRCRRSNFLTMLNLSMIGKKLELYSKNFPLDDGDFYSIRVCFDDYVLLNNPAFLLGAQEREAYFQYLWLRAVNMITLAESWNAVTALAEALLQKKRLSGKAAKKIMAEKISSRLSISFFNVNENKIQSLMDEDNSSQKSEESEAVS